MPKPPRPPIPDEADRARREEFGRRIRTLRQRLGLTQKEFAALLGLSRQGTISRWEKGRVDQSLTIERVEEIVTAARGVRQEGHLVDPRSYALTVLATVEAEVQRHAADTLARIAEARRVLGLADVPSVPAATVEAEAARLKRPATGPRRRPAREG